MALDGEQLAALNLPMAFGIGGNDPFGAPELAERAAALAPDASATRLGLGHLPWLDDADEAAALVLGLARRPSADSAQAARGVRMA